MVEILKGLVQISAANQITRINSRLSHLALAVVIVSAVVMVDIAAIMGMAAMMDAAATVDVLNTAATLRRLLFRASISKRLR